MIQIWCTNKKTFLYTVRKNIFFVFTYGRKDFFVVTYSTNKKDFFTETRLTFFLQTF